AQVAFILFAAAYLAEIVRGGLQAIPRGQYEAADSLGIGYWQRTRLIVLPQALAMVIPPLVNSFIGGFKNTSLVIIIGLFDLLGAANAALTDANWQGFYIEAYVFTAAIYLTFCFFISRYRQMLQRRVNNGRQTLRVRKGRRLSSCAASPNGTATSTSSGTSTSMSPGASASSSAGRRALASRR